MKNKILHIVQETSYNGATIYAYRLCSKIKEYDQEIIACFKSIANDEIRYTIDCENLISTNEVSYKYLLLKYWRLIKFLRKKNYNIIHYHQGGVGLLLLAYLFRKEAVVVHHLHSGNLIGDNTKQDISILHLTIIKYLSNKTHQIAVAAHVFKEYSKKIGYEKNLKLIKNSTPFAFEKKQTRKNAIGFISRFSKEKGFLFLPDISFNLKIQFPKLKILVQGDKPELFSMFFGDPPSNIELMNPKLNTEKFYRSIDLILFLSIAPEGMPLVVLEAISFDIGVIAYPLPALKELLGNNYPLFVNNANDVANIVSSYYNGEIDLNKLSLVHKNVCIKYSELEMLELMTEFYKNIQDEIYS